MTECVQILKFVLKSYIYLALSIEIYNVMFKNVIINRLQGEKQMNVLILSCYTGEGHNSAAYAVKEALERNSIKCYIADPVLFKSKRAQKMVSSLYNGIIKNSPSTFGVIYKAGAIYDYTGITSPVYYANATYSQNLYDFIIANRFDAVISTHLYGMESLTAIKKRTKCDIPFYGVLTDYTVIPFIAETNLDCYFIPHSSLSRKLNKKGLPSDSLIPSGIPVSSKFNSELSKQQAKDILGVKKHKKIILAMSGGIAGGNFLKLCDELIKQADDSYHIFAFTGRNDALKDEIDSKHYNCSQITAVPFTKDINIYMKAADVLLTKPGGLSSTEAAVSNIPMVHVNAIPGCETYNAKFFSDQGMSYNAKNITDAVGQSLLIACDKERADHMKNRQKAVINPYAANDIAERVMRA